jgi:hypothetical protein
MVLESNDYGEEQLACSQHGTRLWCWRVTYLVFEINGCGVGEYLESNGDGEEQLTRGQHGTRLGYWLWC